jgi:hypothetical protein
MNEMRYEQYNRTVMKNLKKEKTVSMTQEPKWIDPQEYSKKVLDNMPKWTEARSPIEIDIVLRPKHYGGKDNPHEVFKVLEAWELDKDFYLGNVIKYVARAGKKNSATYKEDLQKALVYLQRRIDQI